MRAYEDSFSDMPATRAGPGLTPMRAIALALAAMMSIGTVSNGVAAEKLGEAAVIRNTVTGAPPSGAKRNLAVSDAVYEAELITAGNGSHGELRLNDDSLVIVGENSSIALDDFVVSGNGFSSATLNVAKGAFRFITGDSPKGAFKIQTPLSTIGVRGTAFDVYVDEGSGNTKVVLLRGAVRVCTRGQSCLLASRSCDIIEVRSNTDIERIPFLRSRDRSRREEAAQYNLTERQSRFQRRWRIPTLTCTARAALQSQPQGTQNDVPSPDAPSRGDNDNDPGKTID